MTLSKNDITKISKLARIATNEEEISKNIEELNGIFNWIEQLQEVDTENIKPMAGVGESTLRTRDDIINDGNIKDKVLSNGPDVAYGCYSVPKVVE